MATRSDFDIDQGSNVLITMELMNEDRSPKDMTNHVVYGQMKMSYGDDSTEATHFTTMVTNAPNGEVTLSLTNTQTASLDYRKRYMYDFEVRHYDSDLEFIKERILEGLITINPSVTK